MRADIAQGRLMASARALAGANRSQSADVLSNWPLEPQRVNTTFAGWSFGWLWSRAAFARLPAIAARVNCNRRPLKSGSNFSSRFIGARARGARGALDARGLASRLKRAPKRRCLANAPFGCSSRVGAATRWALFRRSEHNLGAGRKSAEQADAQTQLASLKRAEVHNSQPASLKVHTAL